MQTAVHQLREMTLSLPNERVLAELQTVVERVTFSGLDRQDYQASRAVLDELFADELSAPMLAFVHRVAAGHGLAVLGGSKGRELLALCIEELHHEAEVTFISAVPLQDAFQQRVRQQLRSAHPTAGKVVFLVVPALAAGFVIKAEGKIHNYSLHTAAPGLVKKYVATAYVKSINRKLGNT